MKTSVAIDGLVDLDRALMELAEELGKRGARAAVRRALNAAAQPIHSAMVAGAPPAVKPAVEIGDRLTPNQRRLASQGQLTASSAQLFVGVSYRLGTAGRMAHFWEFGTARRTRKNGGDTGQMSMRPFVRPAWDGNRDRALAILKERLWAEIKATTERARRKAARAAAKAAGG